MFGGKYAQKDASKVNIYEIAQLSRASAAPAKSCTEMERTSKGAELRGKRSRNGEKNSLCLIVTTFSKSPGKAGGFVSVFTYFPPHLIL